MVDGGWDWGPTERDVSRHRILDQSLQLAVTKVVWVAVVVGVDASFETVGIESLADEKGMRKNCIHMGHVGNGDDDHDSGQ